MAKLKVVLALLVVLWGAPTLAQSDPGDAGAEDGEVSAQQDQSATGEESGEEGEAADEDEGAAVDVNGEPQQGDDPDEQEADIEEDRAEDETPTEEPVDDGAVAGGGVAGDQAWTFAAFDADGNGTISEEEFTNALYNFIAGQTPDDGLQTDNYISAVETLGVNTAQHAFVNADADDSGTVSRQEFQSVSTTVFDRWDDDTAGLNLQEFSTGMFVTFDTNEDQVITAEELEDYADWFAAGPVEFEQIAGGGAGGFGEDFFRTGDQTMVQPEVEEEAAEEEDAADPMQGQPADDEDAVEDEDPAGDDFAEDAPPGEGGDAGDPDEKGDQ